MKQNLQIQMISLIEKFAQLHLGANDEAVGNVAGVEPYYRLL